MGHQLSAVVLIGIPLSAYRQPATLLLSRLPRLHVFVHVVSGCSAIDLDLYSDASQNAKRIVVWHHSTDDSNMIGAYQALLKKRSVVSVF